LKSSRIKIVLLRQCVGVSGSGPETHTPTLSLVREWASIRSSPAIPCLHFSRYKQFFDSLEMWEREPQGTSNQLRLLTSKRAAASRSAPGARQHALECGERLLDVRALRRDVECALEGAGRAREVIVILLGEAQI